MDLRSIIHSDAPSTSTSTAKASSPTHSYSQSAFQEERAPHSGYGASSPGAYFGRPQPPPLQPPTPGGYQAPAGQHGAQSPYQSTPSAAIGGGSYPFPRVGHQSPPPRAAPQLGHSDSSGSGYPSHQPYNHNASSPYNAPISTPGGSYPYANNQSHSPRSTPTPISAQSQNSFTQRDSPVSAGPPSYSRPDQYYNHQSQPPTPLGPPLFNRSSELPAQKGPYTHERTMSGGSFNGQRIDTMSPSPTSPAIPSKPGVLGSGYPAQSPLIDRDREYSAQRDRERSISVSPKTVKVSSVSSHGNSVDMGYRSHDSWDGGQVTPMKRKQTDEHSYRPPGHLSNDLSQQNSAKSSSPISTFGSIMNGPETSRLPEIPHGLDASSTALNSANTNSTERPVSRDRPPSASSSITPSHHPSISPRPHSSERASSTQSPSQGLSSSQTPSNSRPPTHSSASKRDADTSQNVSTASSQQPVKKRARYDEPPLWARKASRSSSSSPLLPNKRPHGSHSTSHSTKQDSKSSNLAPVKEETNGNTAGVPPPSVTLPQPQAILGDKGPLGPWEPSIINVTPYEEVTRTISDFLFSEVVERPDVSAGAPGILPGQQAQVEIEAKIGHLMDKNTNERLRLPVLTETILSKAADLRIQFESSMTEAQHRSLNEFLNKSLINSQPPKHPPQTPAGEAPPRTRIPMSYVHTHERDSFYELSQPAIMSLPPAIRQQINLRHKLKVRVTTDQKTGKVLAKIVKVRLADLDVYSPRTAFDWRISVNLEMNYEGDIDGLIEVHDPGRRNDRNKDRMSYRHLAYQIDLTQVTPTDATSKTDKEHELEVEVNAAEVRRQGILAKTGQITQYEDLVRGFVDNVRVLARVVNPMEGR